MSDLVLVVRRTIRAKPERLFDAWTDGEQLARWWGPPGTRCVGAEFEARAGGVYRIGNELGDGSVVWIRGEVELVERPRRLVFSWSIAKDAPRERVTVRFDAAADGASTEVIVTHERVANEAARRSHTMGWEGCLAGLDRHAGG